VEMRNSFEGAVGAETILAIMSFGFARGIPRNADLVFDMRFLRNPHWDVDLRPKTGLDSEVGAYIREDAAWDEGANRIKDLLLMLIPRYHAEGKAYLTIAFGCTGGRHRSVHVAEFMGSQLRAAGYVPSISHRDITFAAQASEGITGRDSETKSTTELK
jgi:RNase adapter protein RapZ